MCARKKAWGCLLFKTQHNENTKHKTQRQRKKMTEKELKKLNRRQLLELLLKQTQRADDLEEELDRLKAELDDRARMENQAGSLAEAALKLNDVVEAAQAAFNGVSFFERKTVQSMEGESTDDYQKATVKEAISKPKNEPAHNSPTETIGKEQRANNSKMAEDLIAHIERIKNDRK